MPEPKFIDDAPAPEPQFIDDAPKGKSIAWDHKSSDDDIIKALGYDPETIKKSKFYVKGMFKRSTMEPGGTASRLTSGPLFSALKGVLNVGAGVGQLATRLSPFTNDSDVAFMDMSKKFMDREYERSHTQLGNKKAEGVAKAALDTSEFVGEALPGIAVGGPGLQGAKILSKQGAKQLGKIALAGGAQALTQPVDMAPGATNAEFLRKKAGQAEAGAAFAPAAALGLEGPMRLGKKLLGGAAKIGATKSTGEVMEELTSKLGGKSPGVALQDAADAKYSAAWDEFKNAMAPVDEAAGGVGMDYSGAAAKIRSILGIGQKRSPNPIPKERADVLKALLTNLEEAGKPDGLVDNSFAGAMDVIKGLGRDARVLAQKHGDTEARATLNEVRDAILESMTNSDPMLASKAKEARTIFAKNVAPLFDKSEGGQFLTQIRDTPTPGDLLASGNQGSLARMRPDKAAIVARGSSADPMLYSYLDAAIKQADGNPGVFVKSLEKAMPAVEQIADPEMADAFKGLTKVARTARFTGFLANMSLSAIPGAHMAGAGLATAATLKPAFTGPGIIWKALQSPNGRKLLKAAGKMEPDSKSIDLITRNLIKLIGPTQGEATKPEETE